MGVVEVILRVIGYFFAVAFFWAMIYVLLSYGIELLQEVWRDMNNKD